VKIVRTLILVFALALAASARAQGQQQQQSQPAQRPAPCVAPEFRQFDFWIGQWTVAGQDGKEQGQSQITREAGGCAVNEYWQGAGGPPGVSINYFDRRDGKWHQHWVGGGGAVLHLAGNSDGKAMVMSGERDTPQGRDADRITWTPLADGRVSQRWDISTDGGKTWRTTFLGYYTRRAGAKAEGK
jgi:hypothetical protein